MSIIVICLFFLPCLVIIFLLVLFINCIYYICNILGTNIWNGILNYSLNCLNSIKNIVLVIQFYYILLIDWWSVIICLILKANVYILDFWGFAKSLIKINIYICEYYQYGPNGKGTLEVDIQLLRVFIKTRFSHCMLYRHNIAIGTDWNLVFWDNSLYINGPFGVKFIFFLLLM